MPVFFRYIQRGVTVAFLVRRGEGGGEEVGPLVDGLFLGRSVDGLFFGRELLAIDTAELVDKEFLAYHHLLHLFCYVALDYLVLFSGLARPAVQVGSSLFVFFVRIALVEGEVILFEVLVLGVLRGRVVRLFFFYHLVLAVQVVGVQAVVSLRLLLLL